jgi:hypothetical protein
METKAQRAERNSTMTIADTLYDAANDIRGYIEDDMAPSDKLAAEIMSVVIMMDALRKKIDALGIDRIIVSERARISQKPSSRGNHSA